MCTMPSPQQSGYYMTLMQTSPSNVMCLPCQCNMEGSLSAVCDSRTSQCPCKSGVTGLRCNTLLTGYYVKALDAILFEAEEATLSRVSGSGDQVQWEVSSLCPPSPTFFFRGQPAVATLLITPARDTSSLLTPLIRLRSPGYICPRTIHTW